MDPTLSHSLSEHEYLRKCLEEGFPEADDETLRDTLEGLSSLPEVLSAVIRAYLEDLSLAAALGMRIADMQERLARFEARAERKRALVTQVMERAELKKLQEPEFTVSLRTVPPGLVVSDEAQIPTDYWKPQPAKLDKKGLLASLNAGQAIPGAGLGNGGTTISVRTR
ncbi:MAG: siphovirus Gp157 family protein [Alphaproteobacteria bacterium]|nr:siphovirus Gp157 family protein [Alphaproteobacteria bacterium]